MMTIASCLWVFSLAHTFQNTCRKTVLVPMWVDLDEDGKRDDHEPNLPLADVEIVSVPSGLEAHALASGSDGLVEVTLTSSYHFFFDPTPGCIFWRWIKVEPLAPKGFEAISADAQSLNTASFAFRPLPNSELPTVQP